VFSIVLGSVTHARTVTTDGNSMGPAIESSVSPNDVIRNGAKTIEPNSVTVSDSNVSGRQFVTVFALTRRSLRGGTGGRGRLFEALIALASVVLEVVGDEGGESWLEGAFEMCVAISLTSSMRMVLANERFDGEVLPLELEMVTRFRRAVVISCCSAEGNVGDAPASELDGDDESCDSTAIDSVGGGNEAVGSRCALDRGDNNDAGACTNESFKGVVLLATVPDAVGRSLMRKLLLRIA
jgi:hypothetical protein